MQSKSTLEANIYNAFIHHVPEGARDYCFELWNKERFQFKITKKRSTKLGDYRFDPKTKQHKITVNNDLNPYSFLVTYLHEVAHLLAFQQHGRRIKPHGEEWKSLFADLLFDVMLKNVFPEDLSQSIRQYMKNPKASSCADPELYKALKMYNDGDPELTLEELAIGDVFTFKKKQYKKLEKRRTRALVEEMKSKRQYLIPLAAPVELVNN